MYRLGALIGAIAVTAFTGAALAHDESQAKQHGSRVQRISTSEMKTRLNDLGYDRVPVAAVARPERRGGR